MPMRAVADHSVAITVPTHDHADLLANGGIPRDTAHADQPLAACARCAVLQIRKQRGICHPLHRR